MGVFRKKHKYPIETEGGRNYGRFFLSCCANIERKKYICFTSPKRGG
jgi:hypothetical protein